MKQRYHYRNGLDSRESEIAELNEMIICIHEITSGKRRVNYRSREACEEMLPRLRRRLEFLTALRP